jgi:glycosyltransferase involved in cell wall biosynthesis
VIRPDLVVDARMWRASGIGRYLRCLLPRVLERLPGKRCAILGDEGDIYAYGWNTSCDVSVVSVRSPVYSIREQLELSRRIPREAALFWSPHYNIPVLFRQRILVTVHDVAHLTLPEYTGDAARRFYSQAMFGFVRRRAEAIITVSEFSRSEIRRRLGARCPPTYVVHDGVEESWFTVESDPRPRPQPYFLFVGNVKPQKNLRALVAAFAAIMSQLPHDLLIVGEHQDLRTADEQVRHRAAQLGSRVVLAGRVTDEELGKYYANAEALVFPSLYEGFGLPPLEAMACGCPVLASSAASIPEVCGDAALYFDPTDVDELARQMLLIASDEALRADLQARGKARARLFSWDKSANKTAVIIQQLLSGGRRESSAASGTRGRR